MLEWVAISFSRESSQPRDRTRVSRIAGRCFSLAWRILSIILLVCEMSAIVQEFEHSLALPFFRIGMKTDLLLVVP